MLKMQHVINRYMFVVINCLLLAMVLSSCARSAQNAMHAAENYEKLAQNADYLGNILRNGLNEIASRNSLITLVRGKGLLNAIVINCEEDSDLAWNICLKFRDYGLLAKPTHGNKIRLAPPLVITETQIQECLNIIEKALNEFI